MNSSQPFDAVLNRIQQGSNETVLIQHERQSSNHFQNVYRWIPPFQFRIEEFAKPSNLMEVFKGLKRVGGRASGIDGLSYNDFSESEIHNSIRNLSRCLLDGSYCPQPVKVIQIPKGDGRFRELSLLTILDRVVAKGMELALKPIWSLHLPNLDRDVFRLFAQMVQAVRRHRQYTLAISDVENCFPTTPLQPVVDLHRRILGADGALLDLIKKIIRCQDGTEVGLLQGSPYSPTAMESFLQYGLDLTMDSQTLFAPLLFRYVDNLMFLCSDEGQGRRILNRASNILDPFEMKLKTTALAIIDIREDHLIPTLGFIVGWTNGRLNFKIPEDSYESIEKKVIEAMSMNNHQRVVKHLVLSWIRSKGPALTKAATLSVSDRLIDTCNTVGFRSIQRHEIRDTAKIAYRQWSRLISNQI